MTLDGGWTDRRGMDKSKGRCEEEEELVELPGRRPIARLEP